MHQPAARQPVTERFVQAAPGVRLWTEERGAPDAPPLLLVMGATASGLAWPEELVRALAAHHRVIRYDHRDTGRSTWPFDEMPYPLTDLAEDAVTVMDALEVPQAHLVGLSLGGLLTQIVLSDHPDRVLSATLVSTGSASGAPLIRADGTEIPVPELPQPDAGVVEFLSRPFEDQGPEAEIERRVEMWRQLNGTALPFDPGYFRDYERAIIEHTGHHTPSTAHARADYSGMERTEQLARTQVPVLVVSPPCDPLFPPPHPEHMVQTINNARLVEIPGMGHALPREVLAPLADAVLHHTGALAS